MSETYTPVKPRKFITRRLEKRYASLVKSVGVPSRLRVLRKAHDTATAARLYAERACSKHGNLCDAVKFSAEVQAATEQLKDVLARMATMPMCPSSIDDIFAGNALKSEPSAGDDIIEKKQEIVIVLPQDISPDDFAFYPDQGAVSTMLEDDPDLVSAFLDRCLDDIFAGNALKEGPSAGDGYGKSRVADAANTIKANQLLFQAHANDDLPDFNFDGSTDEDRIIYSGDQLYVDGDGPFRGYVERIEVISRDEAERRHGADDE